MTTFKSIYSGVAALPGGHVGQNYLGNIKILPYSISEKDDMLHVKSNISKGDVVTDIYIRPFFIPTEKARGGRWAGCGNYHSALLWCSFW